MVKKDFTIYCDMDGVLANFNKEINAVERFKSEKGFFFKLEPISENVLAIRELINKGYNVKILTTSPHKKADKDKQKWLKRFLPKINKKDIIFGRPSVPKIDYIKERKNAILIDDYGKNIREWKNGGGQEAIKITPKPSYSLEFKTIKKFAEKMGL